MEAYWPNCSSRNSHQRHYLSRLEERGRAREREKAREEREIYTGTTNIVNTKLFFGCVQRFFFGHRFTFIRCACNLQPCHHTDINYFLYIMCVQCERYSAVLLHRFACVGCRSCNSFASCLLLPYPPSVCYPFAITLPNG